MTLTRLLLPFGRLQKKAPPGRGEYKKRKEEMRKGG